MPHCFGTWPGSRPRASVHFTVRACVPALFAAVLSLAGSEAAASGGAPKTVRAHFAAASSTWRGGRSIGSPTDGRLVGGTHLVPSPAMRICPAYTVGDVRWGVRALVRMVDRSSRTVRKRYPGAVLTVGHLSRAGGGDVDRHVSHESGRDVDLGFYIRSASRKPLLADHFVSFRGDASAASWPGAYFDDARNWALVAALLTDRDARVVHIFVSVPLRARLLAYAEKTGAPVSLRQRAAELMAQPKGVLPHDDHFHVRIACPLNMQGCVEYPTMARAQMVAARPQARGVPLEPWPRSAGTPPQGGHAAPLAPRRAQAGNEPPRMLDDVDGPVEERERQMP